VKIRILVAVDRDDFLMPAATLVCGPLYGDFLKDGQKHICRTYDIDGSTIQWRIVEAEVPGWQEPPVPVVQGEVKEVTP